MYTPPPLLELDSLKVVHNVMPAEGGYLGVLQHHHDDADELVEEESADYWVIVDKGSLVQQVHVLNFAVALLDQRLEFLYEL